VSNGALGKNYAAIDPEIGRGDESYHIATLRFTGYAVRQRSWSLPGCLGPDSLSKPQFKTGAIRNDDVLRRRCRLRIIFDLDLDLRARQPGHGPEKRDMSKKFVGIEEGIDIAYRRSRADRTVTWAWILLAFDCVPDFFGVHVLHVLHDLTVLKVICGQRRRPLRRCSCDRCPGIFLY